MLKKYVKHWGGIETINNFLFIAALVDPRHKERFLNPCIKKLCGSNELAILDTKNEVKLLSNKLFEAIIPVLALPFKLKVIWKLIEMK